MFSFFKKNKSFLKKKPFFKLIANYKLAELDWIDAKNDLNYFVKTHPNDLTRISILLNKVNNARKFMMECKFKMNTHVMEHFFKI